MAAKRGAWRTRFGFYLLAIGSACGLGNLWRFPYVVGENGGGAFILLYVFMALAIGAPMLIAELMLGKNTRKSVMVATQQMAQKSNTGFKWAGRLAVILTIVVFSYYAVISGWVLHFMTQFFVSLFSDYESASSKTNLAALMGNGWLQLMLASAHILITVVVVVKGVQEGLERWISYMMPLFAALVIVLLVKSFSLPSTPEVVRFLFYPDFSKLTMSSLNHALGHVFFTLSLGFGTMVTYGSYMRDEDHVPTAGFRVALVDSLISLVAVMMIFPVAFQASNVPLTDPALMFEVLPRYLLGIHGGTLFGLAFFVCLYMAALNASIGLLEVVVSNFVDTKKNIGRVRATWYSGLVALLLAILPALSSSVLKAVRVGGRSLIESLDSLLINWFLPLVALAILLAFYKGTSEKEKEVSFIDKDKFVSYSMYPHWIFVLKWVAPAIIGLGFVLQVLSLF
ncbi:sodium-dependent transporter [Bdellovibrio svalbardensis]|uniref:Transporter n=1 Tax=Bdellovibrio svalbardensis TaxID=2972972 RepID=A0ABT6DJJ4_9BACT|nr:sodium-dependent transporter [Bdellovibrio svalbardensis]MDG0816662.1 sodium-dependent transporter [Bdellovibrio svalbardensis]